MLVNADAARLNQIVWNLLSNATKFTPAGGTITVRVSIENGCGRLDVADTGIGIDPAVVPRVFEMFGQVHSRATRAQSGLGIGLTLARSLAEMHGGSLEATSPGPGLGSTFMLRLPLAQSTGEVDRPGPPQQQAQMWRVMVVDDNRDSADSTTAILRLLGNQVECAYSGPAALGLARRFQANVVMLDLAMPGMDGFETLRRLRELPGMAHSFGIAMTGFGSQDDKRRMQEAGFDAHLIKPVELDMLIQRLNDARERAARRPAS